MAIQKLLHLPNSALVVDPVICVDEKLFENTFELLSVTRKEFQHHGAVLAWTIFNKISFFLTVVAETLICEVRAENMISVVNEWFGMYYRWAPLIADLTRKPSLQRRFHTIRDTTDEERLALRMLQELHMNSEASEETRQRALALYKTSGSYVATEKIDPPDEVVFVKPAK